MENHYIVGEKLENQRNGMNGTPEKNIGNGYYNSNMQIPNYANYNYNYNLNSLRPKANKSAITSFILSIIGIKFQIDIIYSFYLNMTGHASYMWEIGVMAVFVIIILPLSLLSIIMGAIGIGNAKKIEKDYALRWMAIFGLSAGIAMLIMNFVGIRIMAMT